MQLMNISNIKSVNKQGLVALIILDTICVDFRKQLTCVSRLAGTLVSVDLVNALAIVTWAALTVVQIDLTVNTCEPKSSQALQQKLLQETQSMQ